MEKISPLKMPAQSVAYLAVCGTGILVFFLLVLHPYQKNLARMDKRIDALRNEIENQQILVPFFQTLLAKKESPLPEEISIPGKEKLNRRQTEQLAALFKDAADRTGVTLSGAVPDLETVASPNETMKLTITADGELQSLRTFLSELLKLPFLESMEDVSLRTLDTGRRLQAQIWVFRE